MPLFENMTTSRNALIVGRSRPSGRVSRRASRPIPAITMNVSTVIRPTVARVERRSHDQVEDEARRERVERDARDGADVALEDARDREPDRGDDEDRQDVVGEDREEQRHWDAIIVVAGGWWLVVSGESGRPLARRTAGSRSEQAPVDRRVRQARTMRSAWRAAGADDTGGGSRQRVAARVAAQREGESDRDVSTLPASGRRR